MKKRVSLILVVTMLFTLFVPFTVTADTPTLITDQAGILAMSATGNYKLANDITISGDWSNDTFFKGTFDGDGHTITYAAGSTIHGGLFKQLQEGATVKNLFIVEGGTVQWTTAAGISGNGTACFGGLTGSIQGSSYGTDSFIQNTANKVTIQNVHVNVNLYTNANTTGSAQVAIGGIVGDLGLICRIEDCSFDGSITDSTNRSGADMGRKMSGYGGMVGVAVRSCGTIEIIKCVNNGDITGYGNQGGMLGYSRAWGGGSTGPTRIIIEQCINNGAIECKESATSSSVGGIIGYAFAYAAKPLTVRYCINTGSIKKASDNVRAAGIIGGLRRDANTIFLTGNLQDGATNQGSQIAQTPDGSGDLVCENNYSIAGSGSYIYSVISDANAYAAAFETLNAAYPDTYGMYDGHITLAWAIPAGEHEHSWGEWIVDQKETCTATGSKHRNCTGCDEVQYEDIPASGHNFVDGICTVCGAKEGFLYNQNDIAAMTATGNYTLANDITISGDWNNDTFFKGTLDGAGYTITYAEGSTIHGGLFKQLQEGAIVKNLNIAEGGTVQWTTAAGISGNGTACFGGLVASIQGSVWNTDSFIQNTANKVTIQNVHVNVNLYTNANTTSSTQVAIGGIVGDLGLIATIENCSFSGSITDSTNRSGVDMNTYMSGYGGIVGVAVRNCGTIEIINCVNNATITGYGQEAGILGYARTWGGGATGPMSVVIEDCVNNGAITCLQTELGTSGNNKRAVAGGIAGYLYAGTDKTILVQNNVNNGNVTSTAASELAMAAGIVARTHKGIVVIIGNVNNGTVSTGEGGKTNAIMVQVDGGSGFLVNENDGTLQAGSITSIKGWQLGEIQDGTRSVRFVAGIGDDLSAADKVGIEIRVYDGTKTGDVYNYKFAKGDTGAVYESIYAAGEKVTAAELDAGYLYTAIIENVPTSIGTARVLVRTYHVIGEDTYYGNYSLVSLKLAA